MAEIHLWIRWFYFKVQTSYRWYYGVVIFILALTVLCYHDALMMGWIWDDQVLIVDNPFIRNWSLVTKYFSQPIAETSSYYRPLQMISYAWDYMVWGLNPQGFHLSNIVWHLSGVLLLCEAIRGWTGRAWLALITAVVYAIHPIHSEAVVYIASRADLMVGCFLWLSLIVYRRYIDHNHFLSGLCFVIFALAALMTKEIATTFPVIFSLIHFLRHRKFVNSALMIYVMLVAFYLWSRSMGWIGGALDFTQVESDLWQRLPGSFVAFGRYLKLLIFPYPLFMGYGSEAFVWHDLRVLLGCSIWIVTLSVMKRLAKNSGWVWLGFGFYLIMLLPLLNFFPLSAYMAEHWLYIPSAGLIFVLGLQVDRLKQKSNMFLLTPVVILFVVFMLSLRLINQVELWREPIDFYQHIIKHNPHYTDAYVNLAKEYMELGDYQRAEYFNRKVLKLNNDNVLAKNNLGVILDRQARYKEAVMVYKDIIHQYPTFMAAYNNLALVYMSLGDPHQARAWLKKALSMNSRDASSYYHLALIENEAGHQSLAMEYYQKSITSDPYYIQAWHNLALLVSQTFHREQAISLFQHVLEIQPEYVQAHHNLGKLLLAQDDFEKAYHHFKQAYQKSPNSIVILNDLGHLHMKRHQYENALNYFRQALLLDANDFNVLNNYGIVLSKLSKFEEARSYFERALLVQPESETVYNNVGLSYALNRQWSMASRYYKKALTVKPDYEDAMSNLAYVYEQQKRYDEAMDLYQNILFDNPSHVLSLNGLGVIFAKRNDFRKAVEYFQQANRIEPNHKMITNNLKQARQLIHASAFDFQKSNR